MNFKEEKRKKKTDSPAIGFYLLTLDVIVIGVISDTNS